MPSIKTVGIVTKPNLPEAQALAREAQVFLTKAKRKVLFSTPKLPKEEMIKKCDMVLVLGGDGTFIGVGRRMVTRSIPILGVNLGQLGFLTEVKREELFQALDMALEGHLPISQRTMLECTVVRKGRQLLKVPVVNDVVISKGAIARIFDMQLLVDKMLVTTIKGDGLMVSSPTGSTAYCLAAGGPIVAPNVPAMAIVPICPHSLTLRPLVVPDTSELLISPHYSAGTVVLTLDGQNSINLKSGDEVYVTKFRKHPLRIMHWQERDYYSLLREKLKYGYRD